MTSAGMTLDDFLGGDLDARWPRTAKDASGSRAACRSYRPGQDSIRRAFGAATAKRPSGTEGPRWLCFRCDSSRFGSGLVGCYCLDCYSKDLYNSATPTRKTSAAGTWVYAPREGDAEPNDFDRASSMSSTPYGAETLDDLSPLSP